MMRILITNIAGPVGRLLAQRLLALPSVEAVTGVDARALRPPIEGVRFVRAALGQPEWLPHLRGMDAVVHPLGLDRWMGRGGPAQDAALIDGTKRLARATVDAGVPKLIVLSSAAVYGAPPGEMVTEASPVHGYGLGPVARAQALVADYLDVIAAAWRAGTVTRLRVAWVCGAGAPLVARYLANSPVVACGYGGRRFQALHPADLAAAVTLALERDLPGLYNVGAADAPTFHELAALLGRPGGCVPLSLLVLRARLLGRHFGAVLPPEWVRGLYRRGVVDSARLRAAGWMPRHTTRDALTEALAGL